MMGVYKIFKAKKIEVIGYIDGYLNGFISGWAYTHDFNKIEVSLYIDDEFILTSLSNVYRSDLEFEKIGDGVSGYLLPVPNKYIDGKMHEIKVVAKVDDLNTKEWFKGLIFSLQNDGSIKTAVNIQTENKKNIAINSTKTQAIGCIDEYLNGFISGWACTSDFNKIEVSLYIDDKFILTALSNIYRSDLESEKMGDGAYGYLLAVPNKYFDGKIHNIKVFSKIDQVNIKEWGKTLKFPLQHDEKIKTVTDIQTENKKMIATNSHVELLVNSADDDDYILGSIDAFSGDQVTGWLGCKSEDVYPYITANGKPCEVTEHGLERKDVHKKIGLPEKIGFVAKLPNTKFGNIEFKLHAISMKGISYIEKKYIIGGCLVPNSIATVFEALEISKQDDSVGIVVWEGTHNPIGRAQVLYNVIKKHRPTLVIAFDIGFSTEPVWQPLVNSDCQALILPWKDRELYAKLFKSIGLNFDLIWICKPRYPALVLAEYLSHADTRYIVDLDDNELEMSSSKAAEVKPYGLLSAKMAQKYIDKLLVRSVASKTLKDDFGGLLVRHARKENSVKRQRITDLRKEIRVGFIGTIRPHKGVVEAAKAIKQLNVRKGYKIKFVVGGIYDPTSIRSELIKLGCEIHGKIDSARLNMHLQKLDLIITGFPDDNANKEILKYQISSKVGDGLANERPVLVPDGASVKDLAKVKGIYLFDAINFERILEKAITHTKSILLDKQFKLDFNYKQFLDLEAQTHRLSPRGEDLFRIKPVLEKPELASKQNVILVWKQHDTGLYGRRVDHLARSLAASGMNVTCLELISQLQFTRYEKESARIDSDFRYLVDDFRRKRDGFKENGINYKTISVDYAQDVESGIKRYLINNELYPNNSVVVLFPAVPEWKTVVKCFTDYKVICDIVDNQLAWEKKRPLELLSQYKHIIDISSYVVFNAEDNRKFFADAGYLDKLDVKVLPNWYTLPLGYKKIEQAKIKVIRDSNKPVQIVYSGNMNDRFDWDTVARLPKEIDTPIEIHLIGNCQRSLEKMTYILDEPSIIYHGPMRESELLEFMKDCDLAIMPHINDEHSGFMNPMKVNMYQAIGLPCVASSMPGVDFTRANLYQSHSSDEFITIISSLIGKSLNYECSHGGENSSDNYIQMIQNVHK
jgi:glycosyltransferase involved in cell wall biosynthesis